MKQIDVIVILFVCHYCDNNKSYAANENSHHTEYWLILITINNWSHKLEAIWSFLIKVVQSINTCWLKILILKLKVLYLFHIRLKIFQIFITVDLDAISIWNRGLDVHVELCRRVYCILSTLSMSDVSDNCFCDVNKFWYLYFLITIIYPSIKILQVVWTHERLLYHICFLFNCFNLFKE